MLAPRGITPARRVVGETGEPRLVEHVLGAGRGAATRARGVGAIASLARERAVGVAGSRVGGHGGAAVTGARHATDSGQRLLGIALLLFEQGGLLGLDLQLGLQQR